MQPLTDRDVLQLSMDAFDKLGGRGTLKAHYREVEILCKERSLKCPTEEHVRMTIYNYTPGRKSHLGKGDYFEIIGRGEYRVTRLRAEDLRDLIS